MRALHNSRDIAYRTPYGAVEPLTEVTIAIDIWDCPGAKAAIRSWTAREGERFYQMEADLNKGADGAQRFRATISPEEAGSVWYSFVIEDEHGARYRYGARRGFTGGAGELCDGEPPSFLLSVQRLAIMPPAWHETIADYLKDGQAALRPAETLRTLRENYPAASVEDAYLQCIAYLPPSGNGSSDTHGAGESAQADECGESVPVACFSVDEDVFGAWHREPSGEICCTLFNASAEKAHDVAVPLVDEVVEELVGGYDVSLIGANGAGEAASTDGADSADVADGAIEAPGMAPWPGEAALLCSEQGKSTDWPMAQCPETPSSEVSCDDAPEKVRYALVRLERFAHAILMFHPRLQLQKPLGSGLGVLAHITSLPATEGTPDNGTPDSVTPDSETPEQRGTIGAPAYAFVDWLAEAGMRYWQILPVNPTDAFGSPYAGISAFAGNTNLIDGSARDALEGAGGEQRFAEFCEREQDWLDAFAAFMAIRDKMGQEVPWWDWPDCYRAYDHAALASDLDLAPRMEHWKCQQFLFDAQWRALRAYANQRGVSILGDMPIYVCDNSADVWANQRIFQLDSNGRPSSVAGCPPDAFSVDGQIWGNPVYDWETLRADGYAWWLRRLERAFDLYDFVRLDHFIGFERYFSIPNGQKAFEGRYYPGPRRKFFEAAFEQCGPLPVIAEDLGLITTGVRALSALCGFPGMDIVQFVDGNDPLSRYHPRPGKIAYTGTHDNQTLIGYVQSRYPEGDVAQTASLLMDAVARCNAPVAIFPLQDLMGLGDEARMNTPGTTEGNWVWQAPSEDMHHAQQVAKRLVELHANRLPQTPALA